MTSCNFRVKLTSLCYTWSQISDPPHRNYVTSLQLRPFKKALIIACRTSASWFLRQLWRWHCSLGCWVLSALLLYSSLLVVYARRWRQLSRKPAARQGPGGSRDGRDGRTQYHVIGVCEQCQ